MFDLTVAYIGNYQARHCTEVHVAAALESLGCRVIPLQENGVTLEEMESAAVDADLLLYTRTWGLPQGPEAIAMFRRLEASGVVTASFHLDLYLGLNREATLEGDPFWGTQWVFTPDGDPASEARFAERGIRHVWSPPAVHGPECVLGTLREQFAHPVVFVGSYPYPHPEWPYRNQLVEWLSESYGEGFKRYGGGSTVIRNEPLNDLYRSAGVVVGDSLCPGFSKPNYWSDRITETLGRGGLLIWPEIPGCLDFYGLTAGEDLLSYPFGDFAELAYQIEWALAHIDEGRQIAESGQKKILAAHTYEHRLATLLEAVGLD